MFSTQSDNCIPFVHIFYIIFLFAAELEEPKIGIWGKRLKTENMWLNSNAISGPRYIIYYGLK